MIKTEYKYEGSYLEIEENMCTNLPLSSKEKQCDNYDEYESDSNNVAFKEEFNNIMDVQKAFSIIKKEEILLESDQESICDDTKIFVQGLIKAMNVLDGVYFIKAAWQTVTGEAIKNCFRKAGFTHENNKIDKDLIVESDNDTFPAVQADETMNISDNSDEELENTTRTNITCYQQADGLVKDLQEFSKNKGAMEMLSDLRAYREVNRQSNDDESSSKLYSCHDCDYKAHRKWHLKRYIQAKHIKMDMSIIKKYSCDYCGYKTNNKSDFNRHKLAIHDKNAIKKYVCNHCDYNTHRNSNLKRHVLLKHNKIAIKNYSCDYCDFMSHLKNGLKKHMVQHFKRQGCDYCPYKTHLNGHLEQHILERHDNSAFKKYGCGHCTYKSYRRANLNKHLSLKHDKMAITHNKISIEKFSCNHCDYTSLRKWNLIKHMNKHV